MNAHSSAIATAQVERHVHELTTRGFTIVRGALPPRMVRTLDKDLEQPFANTPFGIGAFYGGTTKRFGRLLIRSPHARALVCHRLILSIVEQVLSPWCDRIQLNTTQAIAVHPGAPAQFPHRDQDMWRGPVGEIEYLVNVATHALHGREWGYPALVWQPRGPGARSRSRRPGDDR